MALPRRLESISRENLRSSLVKEMQEKEQSRTLNAETDILPYFFYKATQFKPLKLSGDDLFSKTLQGSAMIFESPFRADTAEETAINIQYANECALSIIKEGFMPFGSHIKYTGPLQDTNSHERTVGIVFGKLEEVSIPLVKVFVDRGLSFGMLKGLELHLYLRKNMDVAKLDNWHDRRVLCHLEGFQKLNDSLFSKEKEIIEKIDNLLGVKTI